MKDLANIVGEIRQELKKPAYKMEIADGVSVEAVKWALVDAGFKLVPINRGKGAPKDAPKWRIEEFV